MMPHKHRQRGATLIELVVAIVVISIAMAGIIPLVGNLLTHSVDPLLQQQAVAVAQSYLEEMAAQNFCDPNWDPDSNTATTTSCPTSCTAAVCGVCRGSGAGTEAQRQDFDDICDYDGHSDSGARDQFGQVLTGLSMYSVSTQIVTDGVSLNGLQAANGQVALLSVRVEHPAIDPVVLQQFKTNF